jgi:5-formyltetrahydrofolate cyclo-ligase
MTESLPAQKALLRANVATLVRELTQSQREEAAIALCARLIEQPVWKNARAVLLFSPLAQEPNIRPLLRAALAAGKLTALPRYKAIQTGYEAAIVTDADRDFTEGRFGILEPAPHCEVLPLNRLDLALVPGVAFDWHGRRLGRGKGFYDRLLAEVSGETCGVAFDQQMVEAIPVEPHDVRLNCILTPSRWVEVGPAHGS